MRGPLGIIVLVIIVGGAWYLLSKVPSPAPVETATETATTTESVASTTPALSEVTVSYGAQGFSPKSVTVPAGTKVTFVNQGTGKMWVASAVHPTHEVYDGTTKSAHCVAGYTGALPFDQCVDGKTYSFTFTKVGTWKYHNHSVAADTGTVVVTAVAPI